MMDFLEMIKDFFSDLFYNVSDFCKQAWKKLAGVFNNPDKQFLEKVKEINIYRRFRETLVRFYLKRTVTLDKKNIIITWQPLLFIALKLSAAGLISAIYFGLYPNVSGVIKEIILFFRLHEIYNFDMPTRLFLDNLAKICLLIAIGYPGIFFIKYQAEALLSAFVVSLPDRRAYYIKNALILKELYIFSIPEIDHVVLKQNIISRLLGIGTIVLQKKSGESVIIASIKNASQVFTQLSSIISDDSAVSNVVVIRDDKVTDNPSVPKPSEKGKME